MKFFFVISFILPLWLHGQPNCQFFLSSGDTLQYQACNLVIDANQRYYQFSREYQDIMDEALEICPYFAYAYREKSSAYVKSGDFITWKKLIDQAVEYEPENYLSVRASLKFKMFSDYEGAIEDINLLDSLLEYDIGPTSNGIYHLNIAKALCYKALGRQEEAIAIAEKQLAHESHYLGAFDYLHLGVLYLENKQFTKAIEALQKQEEENNLAENHFYTALVYKSLGQTSRYVKHLEEARKLYESGYYMFDPYNYLLDQIDLENIENEMKTAYNKP